MKAIAIQNFKYGLDVRRLEETSQPGTLVALTNGHINQGGEIEKRKAFVLAAKPSNAFGLEQVASGLVMFGSVAAESLDAALPDGVTYQRLQAPDTSATMTGVISSTSYAGKAFVVATFSNGETHVFYDGVLVADFTSGLVLPIQTTNESLAAHLSGLLQQLSSYSSSYHSGVVTLTVPAGQELDIVSTVDTEDGVLTIAKAVTGVAGIEGSYARGQFTVAASAENANVNRIVSILANTTELLAVTRVTAYTRASDVVTLTTAAAHGLVAGNTITIVGMEDASFNANGVIALAGTTGSTIVYANTGADVGSTASTLGLVALEKKFVDAKATPELTAAALVDAINLRTVTTNIEASVQGSTVFLRASAVGTTLNDKDITVRVEGAVCVGLGYFDLKQANDATAVPGVTNVFVNGVDLLEVGATHHTDIVTGTATSLSEAAGWIAAEIRDKSGTSYTAVAVSNRVYLSRKITASSNVGEEIMVIVGAGGGVASGNPFTMFAFSYPNEAFTLFCRIATTTPLPTPNIPTGITENGLIYCLAVGGTPPYAYSWVVTGVFAETGQYNSCSIVNGTQNQSQVQIRVAAESAAKGFPVDVTATCTITDARGNRVIANPVKFTANV